MYILYKNINDITPNSNTRDGLYVLRRSQQAVTYPDVARWFQYS
jgi:hypothetical protein